MNDSLFWLLWFATLCVCGWQLLQGIRFPARLLEWPFLVSAMWMYFYVYMARDVALGMSAYISNNAFLLGQLFPLLCIIATVLGWNLAKPKVHQRPAFTAILNNEFTMWMVGLGLIIMGAAGGYMMQAARAAAGGQYDFENTSAYVYMFFWVGYPGMALAFWMASKWKGRHAKLMWAVTFVSLCIFLYPHVAFLRRGPTFPAIILMLLVPPLARRTSPRRVVYIGGLVAVGVAMMAYLPMRAIINKDGTWQEAFSQVDVAAAVTERSKDMFDNEYVNNCFIIAALAKNGKFQYGTGHLSLFLHWIPRAFWKSKPGMGEGYYPSDELFDDVEAYAGVKTLGGGAAAACVADSFVQYGFLCPLFWFGLSWFISRAYWKGRYEGNIIWMNVYFAFVCATHWLISQGFAAAFVPLCVFIVIPILVLRSVGKIRYTPLVKRRKRRSRSTTNNPSAGAPPVEVTQPA